MGSGTTTFFSPEAFFCPFPLIGSGKEGAIEGKQPRFGWLVRLTLGGYTWPKANDSLIFVQRIAVGSEGTEDRTLWLAESLKQCGVAPGPSECGPWALLVSLGHGHPSSWNTRACSSPDLLSQNLPVNSIPPTLPQVMQIQVWDTLGSGVGPWAWTWKSWLPTIVLSFSNCVASEVQLLYPQTGDDCPFCSFFTRWLQGKST